MCLIIYKPATAALPREIIKKGWDSNSHGAGFMVSKGDGFIFHKGFFKLKHLLQELAKYKDNQVAIHLRMATHGAITAENCHPFIVSTKKVSRTSGKAESLLMHNGVLSAYGNANNSDSWHFAREALAPLTQGGRDRILQQISGKFCYGYKGQFFMYGMELHKDSGCFVSNKYWEYKSTFGYGQSCNYTRGSYSLNQPATKTLDTKTATTQSTLPAPTKEIVGKFIQSINAETDREFLETANLDHIDNEIEKEFSDEYWTRRHEKFNGDC